MFAHLPSIKIEAWGKRVPVSSEAKTEKEIGDRGLTARGKNGRVRSGRLKLFAKFCE